MNVWRPVELALAYGTAIVARLSSNQQAIRRTDISAEVGDRAAHETATAHSTAIRLAPKDRFALPDLRPRSSSPDPFR
jgi:hypothetical protein